MAISNKGPVIRTFGIFQVTDDGLSGHKYGVWATNLVNNWGVRIPDKLIGSGMDKQHALMVAEALDKCKAGNPLTPLTEGRYI